MSTSTGLTLNLHRNTAWKPNGGMDYARSARKWGIQPTKMSTFFVKKKTLHRKRTRKGMFSSLMGGGDAEVPAENVQNDLEYVVPVTIGTPGQTLKLDFDTGSADLWVWSTLLPKSTKNTKGHTVYDPKKSTTAKIAKGQSWKISYGDGSGASGKVYTDTVKLDDLSIPGQSVELASKLSSAFLSESSSDGLLGLAFPTINTVSPKGAKTPVEQLVEQKIINEPIFTVKLDKGDSNGFYTFGYIAVASVSGIISQIIYANIDSSNGFWEFPSPEIRVGDVVTARETNNTAIADTGTTLILLSDAATNTLYESIEGANLDHNAGGWILPTNASVPDIYFSVAGTFFGIAGDDLKFADAGNGMSFGAIQSRGQNPQDILGDVFLKRVYAVFDQTAGAPRIGFGQRALA